jgi:spore coat protein SA
MIYHLLPEVEPFSEHDGGSLSRWTANVLRRDDAQIVCASADGSWGFARERIHVLRGLGIYGKFLKSREYRLRISLRVPVVGRLLRGFVDGLKKEDVLYIHNRPEYVLALQKRAALRAGFKMVLHMHNDHLRNLSLVERVALHPDLAVFNSRFLERQGNEFVSGLRDTAVLYNGADESCFHPPVAPFRPEIPVVLFVGRLIPEKGVHVLLEAMDLLQKQGVKINAKVVGSVNFGDDRGSAYVDGLHRNAPANVAFIPYVAGDALAEHFRSSTIFCCPSIWEEPFGMVNVEAMASGLPVVASRVGGIPEIFARGGGILVAKGSPVELAAALQRLAEDETERRHLAAQALAIFQNRFRWNVIREDYRALMHRLETGAPYRPAHAS